MNLFEADSIPNQGYDAYRAGTLIAAGALCRSIGEQLPGVHTEAADAAIAAAGLYDAYFDLYFSSGTGSAAELTAPQPRTCLSARERRHACVVGYGAAGRLHADILSQAGMRVTIIDPKHHQSPTMPLPVYASMEALCAAAPAPADLWSVCAPTGPGQPTDRITVTFTKDRKQDISAGRFVDRIYGVLGYEWLHMLAVVRQILPSNLVVDYLAADPARSDLYATYDERFFVHWP